MKTNDSVYFAFIVKCLISRMISIDVRPTLEYPGGR